MLCGPPTDPLCVCLCVRVYTGDCKLCVHLLSCVRVFSTTVSWSEWKKGEYLHVFQPNVVSAQTLNHSLELTDCSRPP